MKFSKNGKYVATAGQDGVIRVWEVILQRGKAPADPTDGPASAPTNGQSTQNGTKDLQSSTNGTHQPETGTLYDGYCSDCPVLTGKPYRVYQGHKQDVLELCWSKSQFVLSASMDKTVKLWHISMDDCLRTFK